MNDAPELVNVLLLHKFSAIFRTSLGVAIPDAIGPNSISLLFSSLLNGKLVLGLIVNVSIKKETRSTFTPGNFKPSVITLNAFNFSSDIFSPIFLQ